MRIARLATIGLVAFSVFSTGCIGCIEDEEGNSSANNNNTTANNTTPTAECQDTDVQGVIENGSLTEDTVLCGLVQLEADLLNSDSIEIRIRPGTVIEVGVDRYIDFGWAGNEATIIAEGTAEDPIVFRGSTQEAGHWEGIFLSTVTSASVMRHVVIQHAGGGGEASLNLRTDKDVEISDITIEDTEGPGVYAENFGEGSANLTVRNGGDVAAVLNGTGAITNFPLGGTFENLETEAIAIDGGSLSGEITFNNPGIPYLARADILNNDTSTFTFEAGVELQFETDRYIEFGWAGNEATVNINGTESEPVRFVGSTPDPGHWEGMYVSAPVTSSSVLQNFEVEHVGAGDEVGVDFRTNVTVINATMRNNSAGGFRIGEEGLEDDSSNLTVENSDGPSGFIHANALTTLPSDGSFGDGTAYVLIDVGTMNRSGTIPAIDVPYRVGANILNGSSIDITIESGAEFAFESDRYWEFGWAGNEITLDIDGVTFRGTDSSAGHWDGLYISAPTTSSSSIQNCTIEDGGISGEAAVELRTDITFTGNTVRNSAGACVEVDSGDTTPYESNTFDCTEGDFL